MIRFFNVYYPTRTVILVLGEAFLVFSCFLLATLMVLRQDAYIVLNYEYGWLKIAGVTLLTLLLSYYFDLYDTSIINNRRHICTNNILAARIGLYSETPLAYQGYTVEQTAPVP